VWSLLQKQETQCHEANTAEHITEQKMRELQQQSRIYFAMI